VVVEDEEIVLNEIFPYTKDNGVATGSVVNTEPLDEVEGTYLVLQEIHSTLPRSRRFLLGFTFHVGTNPKLFHINSHELPITKNNNLSQIGKNLAYKIQQEAQEEVAKLGTSFI
jgi:hypothetical protein